MAGQQIPTAAPDIAAAVVALLAGQAQKVSTEQQPQTPPYTALIVSASLQNPATAISRYCRVGVQAWAVLASGDHDLAAAFTLAKTAAATVEAAAGVGVILSADVDAGPYPVTDQVSGTKYAHCGLLLEVLAG